MRRWKRPRRVAPLAELGLACCGSAETSLTRRSFLRRSLAAAGTLALGTASAASLSGCSREDDPNVVNVFAWVDYIPDEAVARFEEETGIRVNLSTYSSNEDMLAKVRTENPGTYDVVQPSDYMVDSLSHQGLLQPLDHSRLSQLGNIGKQYLDWPSDPGNVYSVPYMGSCTAIGVNRALWDGKVESWADLLDASFANKLMALNDIREMMCVLGMTAELTGNETDDESIEQLAWQARKLKPNVKVFNSDDPMSVLVAGDCPVGITWTAEIALAMGDNEDIEVVFPREGCVVCTDNWAIPAEARHYDNAMTFIDFLMRPEIAVLVSEEYPYVQVNQEALALLDDEYLENPAVNVPAREFERGDLIRAVGPNTMRKYDSIWTELKG